VRAFADCVRHGRHRRSIIASPNSQIVDLDDLSELVGQTSDKRGKIFANARRVRTCIGMLTLRR
jgi:hypothetical protein